MPISGITRNPPPTPNSPPSSPDPIPSPAAAAICHAVAIIAFVPFDDGNGDNTPSG
jgi:hypothetical protein